jgi:exopolysaccharide biosynthesis predicted pyruvyltransferase EpsI
MAAAIGQAEFVVTSSLHAFVFANALGIPAQLVSFGSETHEEPNFKYKDYMSVFGLGPRFVPISTVFSDSAERASARQASEIERDHIAVLLPGIVESIAAAYAGVPSILV